LKFLLNLFFRWPTEAIIIEQYTQKMSLEITQGGLHAHRDAEGITTIEISRAIYNKSNNTWFLSIPKKIWEGKLPRKIDKVYWRHSPRRRHKL